MEEKKNVHIQIKKNFKENQKKEKLSVKFAFGCLGESLSAKLRAPEFGPPRGRV